MSSTRPNDTVGTKGDGWILEYGHRVTRSFGTCTDCGSTDFKARQAQAVEACREWPGGLCLAWWHDWVTSEELARSSADHWRQQAARAGVMFVGWEYVTDDPAVCARFVFHGIWEVRYGMNRAGYISGPNAIRAFRVGEMPGA